MSYYFFHSRHGRRKRSKVILIDKFDYYYGILGIHIGKDIKVVELSHVESNFVMNCYVFFKIFIYLIASVENSN